MARSVLLKRCSEYAGDGLIDAVHGRSMKRLYFRGIPLAACDTRAVKVLRKGWRWASCEVTATGSSTQILKLGNLQQRSKPRSAKNSSNPQEIAGKMPNGRSPCTFKAIIHIVMIRKIRVAVSCLRKSSSQELHVDQAWPETPYHHVLPGSQE